MPGCKLCGKKGLFLKLDERGYCKECALHLAEADARRKREQEARRRAEMMAAAELDAIPDSVITLSGEARKRRAGYEEVKFSNITPKGAYNEFVAFDTETTGLAPSKGRIIEIGAIRFRDGKPVEKFRTLVNPGIPVPEEATEVNCITDEMVAGAPTISQVLPAFESFVGGSPLVAHNLEFDLKFMFYSGSTITDRKRKYYDTLEQSRKLLKKPKVRYDPETGSYEKDYDSDFDVDDHKLGTLCDYYGITVAGRHRADADALAAGKLFLSLVQEKQG